MRNFIGCLKKRPEVREACIQNVLDAKADCEKYGMPLMVEPLVFGREASGEILQQCSLDDRVCITTEGTPIYVDRVKLDGDIASILKRPAVAAGAGAMASIVLVDQMAKAMIDGVRALLPSSGGASLLADNILVIRLLCSDSFALRTALLPILTHLTHNAVPKNWRL